MHRSTIVLANAPVRRMVHSMIVIELLHFAGLFAGFTEGKTIARHLFLAVDVDIRMARGRGID